MGSANLTFENRLFSNILAIIPLFVEYWKPGCKVTCSPIDTAEAFDAPVFPDSPNDIPVNELVKTVGSQNVK